mmetsp:Transcript_80702/g.203054  ORF Transcript_80702/g.203054 Transcript_80702/m.203054 type:complete len:93 (-) Transcript_80702:753-1031(-)
MGQIILLAKTTLSVWFLQLGFEQCQSPGWPRPRGPPEQPPRGPPPKASCMPPYPIAYSGSGCTTRGAGMMGAITSVPLGLGSPQIGQLLLLE